MKIIDFLQVVGHFEKEAEKRGHICCSVDIEPFEGIDIVMDCEHITINDLPFIPDVCQASLPCMSYSIAAISHHRNGQIPISEFAKKSDRMAENMLKLFADILKVNQNFKFYIENPRGMLRKMKFMQGIPRNTVCYCKYGDSRMKPTDWWTNNEKWIPRPMCHNYKYDADGNIINKHCHHESARRGTKTGTQGRKNNYERSKIPSELCKEIIEASEACVQ